jgi:tRNA (guanine37-N1)-methyltransferase
VLLSGNHAEIERWRRRKSIEKTLLRRPDLIDNRMSSEAERREIEEILKEIMEQG